jgi:hypothetical protein
MDALVVTLVEAATLGEAVHFDHHAVRFSALNAVNEVSGSG